MNFINDRELARRFKSGKVPSKERFVYFMIMIMLMTLISSSFIVIPLYSYDDGSIFANEWDSYTDIATLAITFFGTIWLYRTNEKGDDKEFVERYICIGFPVIIQTALLIVAIFITADSLIEGGLPLEPTIYDLAMLAVAEIYFYARLNQSIKLASS